MNHFSISITCNIVAVFAFVMMMMGATWFNDIEAKWFKQYWSNIWFKWTYGMACLQLFFLSFITALCYHNNFPVLDYLKWW